MQVADVQGNLVHLLATREDMRMLELVLRAGLGTDPILRRTTDEETKILHGKISSLVQHMDSGEVEFSLSRDEFLNMSIIVGAVNTMDPEIYYEDMLDEFPSDNDLDGFTQRLEGLYDQAFSIG